MDAFERKYHALKWNVERRLKVAFCQAMSALFACFQQTLYEHTHESRDAGANPPFEACGIDYLEMLTRVGFLFSVESLLSTYGTELGMLGDTEAAVKELARVQLKLRPVNRPGPQRFASRSRPDPRAFMHRIPDQDARSGVFCLALGTPEERLRAKFLFQKPIPVVPVLFSHDVYEMQTVANTVGRDALQKYINAENVLALEAYVKALAAWGIKKQVRDGTSTPLVAQLRRCFPT
ncbi:hypothetical protein PsorP6_011702 [Peronosclerospora sorghi]|uniref:Uncharacterized protein n=1 Tax=Peronosclerospora sorghi TaxID=230839 RepID=A0ACC0WHH0_9STRA|nr:hypothetical protein PsorP6_011702 [Peronosclerospora sorghi]